MSCYAIWIGRNRHSVVIIKYRDIWLFVGTFSVVDGIASFLFCSFVLFPLPIRQPFQIECQSFIIYVAPILSPNAISSYSGDKICLVFSRKISCMGIRFIKISFEILPRFANQNESNVAWKYLHCHLLVMIIGGRWINYFIFVWFSSKNLPHC